MFWIKLDFYIKTGIQSCFFAFGDLFAGKGYKLKI